MTKSMKKCGFVKVVQLVVAFAMGFLLNAWFHTRYAFQEASTYLAGTQQRVHYTARNPSMFLEASPTHDQPLRVGIPTTATISVSSTTVAIGHQPSMTNGSRYWNYCGGAGSCPELLPYGGAALPADEQFLLFDTHGAGWNNDRSSLELGYALAFVWRRTLVLPEWVGNPCDPNSLEHVNNTYDIRAMSAGIRVITAMEFIDYAKAHPHRFPGGAEAVARLGILDKKANVGTDWRKFAGWIRGLEGVAATLFPDIPELVSFVTVGGVFAEEELRKMQVSWQFRNFAGPRADRKPLALSQEQSRRTAVYIGPRVLLGNFYSMIFVPDSKIWWQLRNTVRRALHVHPQFFDAADAALNAAGLSSGKYGSLHNRQGDFQQAYKDFWFDPKNPDRFLKQPQNLDFLRRHGRVFMALKATPSQMKDLRTIFFPALRRIMPQPKLIITLADKVRDAAMAVVGHIKGWQGIVDMIICAQGEEFLGSWGSTFTGYIHRLRGYMPFILDKRFLYTDNSKNGVQKEFPSWNVPGVHPAMISWMREWPESYQF